ncbi:ATP-dependent RecD-like DNA helicase [Phocicoccus pinnipedialis]|uniref:ATP-dependent RecD2 DNA helicase n=1 Tax=Phocicoccus pinnipedialis TaxID=110845 RepID=A0A6V7RGN5_9BACL|nr:ATP-dependent RecD-like DNA helicase [Jeotgalicoccus pinnipedialis]MBP1939225.1 exodeoxyribonuclease V alpha subunit [Jeotgalicoccus pinnipedialis]CAD2076234.1 ATP-dependent RecD-like DNA helicase [Jeotgalicoccus pinnipedialis]
MTQMTLDDEPFVIGEIDRVIFHNKDNHFYVCVLFIHETNTELIDETIVTGNFYDINEGETYRFTGQVTEHQRYGKQFQAKEFKKDIPRSEDGLVEYLSGNKFVGVGPKTAEAVVNTLGINALKKIAEDYTVLHDVPGISDSRKRMIYRTIKENYATEEADLIMIELGIEPVKRAKIFDTYQSETLNILTNTPYKLVEDIFGIGFKKADLIALKAGIQKNSSDRLSAGIHYCLERALNEEGHTYITLDNLITDTLTLLNDEVSYFDTEDVTEQVNTLASDDKLVVQDDRITDKLFYYSEKNSANKIYELSQVEMKHVSTKEIERIINRVETELNITYNEEQKDAITHAVRSPLSIITGGPGTGKTTIVKGIIETIRQLNDIKPFIDHDNSDGLYPIQLAAPTGRAAKRMKETTGIDASTIHRLIGWGRETEDTEIIDNIIDTEFIIVDEMSMVDTWLFYQFIKNVLPETQIVFVGDDAQLPSVGPGTVFKDLIESRVIPVTKLKTIYRQAEGSSIVKLAYEINNGQQVNIKERHDDRSFIEARTDQIADVVDIIVKKAVERGFDMRDVQVLAPIYRGPAGINALNQVLQKVLNPRTNEKNEIVIGEKVFRESDKVIQLINRREDNVFNGDAGIIHSIVDSHEGSKESVTVDFDGNLITYERKDLSELAHAYCTSIHKAQGSEYPIVIMPIVPSYYHMLQKNIIYTGVTRAKDSLIICGDANSFLNGIKREGIKRNTMLETYLHEIFKIYEKLEDKDIVIEESSNPKSFMLTESMVIEKRIDPMINMNGVTPFDFN